MLDTIIQFLLASILLTISPGPDIIYVLVTGLSKGTSKAIYLSIGLVSGIIVHTTLVAFGFSSLIKSSEFLFFIVKFLGAVYLIYLAFRVYKSPSEIDIDTTSIDKKSKDYFKQGFLMNVLNPKVTLFFMALLPQFIWDDSQNTYAQFYILGLLFIIQAFIIFLIVAIFANTLYSWLKRSPKSGILFKYIQIIVLVGIAIFIMIDHEH